MVKAIILTFSKNEYVFHLPLHRNLSRHLSLQPQLDSNGLNLQTMEDVRLLGIELNETMAKEEVYLSLFTLI